MQKKIENTTQLFKSHVNAIIILLKKEKSDRAIAFVSSIMNLPFTLLGYEIYTVL